MKKSFLCLALAALMIGAYSCSSDSNKAASETSSTETLKPVEPRLTPGQKNSKAGKEYIENLVKTDSTVKVTESGLAYKVIKEGQGAKPAKTNTVKVDYTGRHVDGKVFDSSNGAPIEFPLNGVIPGFSEGLMLMNKGAVYELYIPGELAYGEGGANGVFQPNELLIFEIELIDFK